MSRTIFNHIPKLSIAITGRDGNIAVPVNTRSRRNDPAHDHVFLQPAQVVHRALDAGFREHLGGFLEGGRRNEGLGGQGRLGDAQQQAIEFAADLPRYKRPRLVYFDQVPRNATGKLEKPKLRQKYATGD